MKMLSPLLILSILLICFLGGCQQYLSDPTNQSKVVPVTNMNLVQSEILPVAYQDSKEIPSFMVQYKTMGKNVFVECILRGISFRESEQTRQKVGKLIVWIDGERNQEVSTAAFIIKSLPQGNHKVKLEVVNLNNVPYGLTKEFMVNIPK